MIKIFFTAPWIKSQETWLNEIQQWTPNGKPEWGSITAVKNIQEADYIIVLQKETAESSKIPYSKKIYFQQEPSYIEKPEQNKGYKFYGCYKNNYHVGFPWIHKEYTFLKNFKYIPRIKPLVVIMSNKTFAQGHKQRFEILKAICRHPVLGSMIDVYGKGLNNNICNGRYLGVTPTRCKFDILSQYKYALAFENGIEYNYFTEKLLDCYLSLAFPIYIGCPNIKDYFNENSMLNLTDLNYNINNVLESILKLIVKEPPQDLLIESRDKVLDNYNIWPSIYNILL